MTAEEAQRLEEKEKRAHRLINICGGIVCFGALVVAVPILLDFWRQIISIIFFMLTSIVIAVSAWRAAFEKPLPLPETGWKGEEMTLTEEDIFSIMHDKGLTLQEKKKILACAGIEYNPKGSDVIAPATGKYIARDVPAHENTPDVLVDEYNPAYIDSLKQAAGKVKSLEPGAELEINEK